MAEQPESQELNTEENVQVETAAEQAAAAEVEAPAQEESGVEQLQAELEEVQAALAEAKDQALRAAADAQNQRRRAEQDVEKAHKFALEKFVAELLPVVDSLERAIDACQPDDAAVAAIREGVEMTLGMFSGVLGKFNVAPLNPEGEPFDPQLHQAMSMVENPELEPNTVMAVMQKGYTLNERLVRPAMVMVSKAAPTDTPKIDEKA